MQPLTGVPVQQIITSVLEEHLLWGLFVEWEHAPRQHDEVRHQGLLTPWGVGKGRKSAIPWIAMLHPREAENQTDFPRRLAWPVTPLKRLPHALSDRLARLARNVPV